jgi:hypothetical protein
VAPTARSMVIDRSFCRVMVRKKKPMTTPTTTYTRIITPKKALAIGPRPGAASAAATRVMASNSGSALMSLMTCSVETPGAGCTAITAGSTGA